MTNLWDKIVSASGLPECDSIASHICAAVGNTMGDPIYIKDETNVLINEYDKIGVNVSEMDDISVLVDEYNDLGVLIEDHSDLSVSVENNKNIIVTIECPC